MSAYRIAHPARVDLLGIREYLAPAPRQVQLRIISALRRGFERAATVPVAGQYEPEYSSQSAGPVRSLLVSPYRIFYRPETNPVIIVAIMHGARDIPTILRQRAKHLEP